MFGQLFNRIIGRFDHVNDGFHALQVLHRDVTKVLGVGGVVPLSR
jgi:hypothetical protein